MNTLTASIRIPQWLKTFLILITLYVPFHLVLFGAHFYPCDYTATIDPTPEKFTGKQITFPEGTYYVTDSSANCVPGLPNTDKLIVPPGIDIMNIETTPISPNTTFKVIKTATIVKHGIGNIEGGSSSNLIYILEDERKVTYKVLGIDPEYIKD
jgi:hypothetical protein